MKTRYTIYDIAREVGVSTKTVSKAINKKPGVSRETREKIQAVIEKVGFHPHHSARTLRGNKRNCVGVTVAPPLEMVPLSQDFLLWLFAKLSEHFSAQGSYLTFDMAPRTGEHDNSDYGRGVWQRMYDVCLVVGPIPIRDIVLPRIHATHIPYLALGRLEGFPQASTATVDFYQGAYDSTRFLIERGHRRIALLAVYEEYQAGMDRVYGYRQALLDHKIPEDASLMRFLNPIQDDAAAVLADLLAQSGVTAFIDSSVMEDSTALRQATSTVNKNIGNDIECVVWTYMKNAAVLKEAAAHLWVPVLEASMEGIKQLAAWAAKERVDPIKINWKPILNDAEQLLDVRKPTRISELL